MRYVKNNLVFRLNRELTNTQLDELTRRFADIVEHGQIEQREAFPTEQDEVELAEKPRLVFHFNRRNLGRLRQMIDYLNCC